MPDSPAKIIPYLAYDDAPAAIEVTVIREQAGTFADSIKLWSEA